MSDKPKRRWFQIHLSTAIVMLIISGLMAGPAVAIFTEEQKQVALFKSVDLDTESDWIFKEFTYLMFALPFLISIAVFCEWLIRRREISKAMIDKQKRQWFQIHLSTALVLMVTAGWLVGQNFKRAPMGFSDTKYLRRGWPFIVYSEWQQRCLENSNAVQMTWDKQGFVAIGGTAIHPLHFCINFLIGLSILIIIALVWESDIRRRERWKI